jgi:hypothetical protein
MALAISSTGSSRQAFIAKLATGFVATSRIDAKDVGSIRRLDFPANFQIVKLER